MPLYVNLVWENLKVSMQRHSLQYCKRGGRAGGKNKTLASGLVYGAFP